MDNLGEEPAEVRHHVRVSQHAYELPVAGDDLSRLADEAAGGEVVYLTRDGRQVAAVVPAEVVPAALEAMEDAEDLAVAEAAMAEWEAGGRVTYPADEAFGDPSA